MSADAQIQVLESDDVTIVRMHDGKVNAMSPAMLTALGDALDRALSSDARAVVLTGDGKSFSAGLALPELIDLDRATLARFMDVFGNAMRRVLTSPRPTVAAINGHAIAGGCVLALMCDVRVMTSAPAKIGLSEVQLGIGLPAIVVEPLRIRVPPTSWTPIALEGLLVEPEEALRLGLVDEVVAPGDLVARATARAKALGRGGQAGYAQAKLSLLRPVLEAIAAHDASAREAWLDTWFSDEAQTRLRATVARLAQRTTA
jgi:enoyl-CoA hydratase